MYLAGRDLEIKSVEGTRRTECLDQSRDRDCRFHAVHTTLVHEVVKLNNHLVESRRHVPRKRPDTRDPVEVRHFIERLSLMFVEMGFPPMPARVWATMMCADEDVLTPGDL